MQPEWHQGFIV